MTYQESSDLMNDLQFRGRIKVSALTYAKYIMGEPVDAPAHSTRLKWAGDTYRNPELQSTLLHPPVVMTDQVQTDGVSITDARLQSAVETVINKLM